MSLVPGPGWNGGPENGDRENGDRGLARGSSSGIATASPIRRLHGRLRPRVRPRYKGPSFNRVIPNILTLLGLSSGLTGLRFALGGHFGPAVVAIVVAGAIDGLDGRIARLLKGVSRFGAEFDSLSDFFCFGVAPAFIVYLWSLERLGGVGFIPCLMFAVCMALRLARFNAALEGAPRPAYAYNFFTGVPAPAGAGLALFPLFLGLEAQTQHIPWLLTLSQSPLFTAPVLAGTALLSVSTLPVWSFKNFKVPADYVLPMLLGVGLSAAVLVADPWGALAAAVLLYAGMLPFSRRSFHRLQREAEEEPEA
ncbi:MAG: phosphatidylcholine/phosphatidylserine synthase [Rhodospirillales bacterium]|nr:phosphatidylcholine/phosphatidylserine synthase [Rhodospirillales bacterium]